MKKLMFIGAAMLLVIASAVYAATVDATDGGVGYGAASESSAFTIERVLDLSVTAVASGDDVQVLSLTAGTLVQMVTVDVETVTASDTTIDVGDDTTATQYLSNTSSSNATITAAAVTTAKYYTAADTIDLHFDGAPGSTGVIRVKALVIPMKADRP